MRSLVEQISKSLTPFINETFEINISKFDFQATRKEFDGDITLVVFSLLKFIKMNPIELSNKIGEFLNTHCELVSGFNVVDGFLNLCIQDLYYINALKEISETKIMDS